MHTCVFAQGDWPRVGRSSCGQAPFLESEHVLQLMNSCQHFVQSHTVPAPPYALTLRLISSLRISSHLPASFSSPLLYSGARALRYSTEQKTNSHECSFSLDLAVCASNSARTCSSSSASLAPGCGPGAMPRCALYMVSSCPALFASRLFSYRWYCCA